MRKVISIISLLMFLSLKPLVAQEIKFANYYLYPTIDMEQAENLSKYDLLILDPNNLFLNKEVMDSIKSLNPEIKFLAYFNPMEIFKKEYIDNWGNKPIDKIISKYLHGVDIWWLTDSEGNIFEFDRRQKMLNMSDKSKRITVSYFDKQKMRYWEFITKLDLQLILSDKIWDGIFEDNFETVEWLADYDGYTGVDIDADGRNESKEKVAKSWEAGLRKRLELIKSEHPDYLVLANKALIFLPELTHGKMLENFPDHWLGTWHKNIENAEQMENVILNFKEERFEMALASALWLYDENKTIYLSIAQQDSFKNYYHDYKKLGKIESKRIDTTYLSITSKGLVIEKTGALFDSLPISQNEGSGLFFTTSYIYTIEMENGIVRFNPYTDPEHPRLENFEIEYY
ncbi:MAG: hypothetical protein ACLFNO_03515 [Parcubacteria group bacterium]